MKRIFLFSLLLTLSFNLIEAQSPKREFRATWLTTVWQIDWPKTSGATNQKNEMITLLDQLKDNNLNAICFQVRGRCDAFYDSAYEPWSSDLGNGRGTYPGYDPLQFVIDEAHARGIEVHAWLNPYRYESQIGTWTSTTLKGNYRYSHPGWLLDYTSSSMSILNPGIPEVRQRISDVVADILNKYDVDGIVFDDYFYVSGTSDTMDQAQYSAYNPKGLSRANWRRDNVNQMIKDVYDRIQSIKPYVTFGVSPAGVAKLGAGPAGLTTVGCTCSDWQYNDIYSDPCAWLSQGSLDYISPQIYWNLSHSTNPYNTLCKWWSDAAKQFGKHFYSSHSSSNYGATEMNDQIASNRTYTQNSAPGSIFYNTTGLKGSLSSIKSSRFTHKALAPAIDWKAHPAYGNVSCITRSGTTLSWNAVPGVSGGARYTVYGVPTSVSNPVNACSTSSYLLGISYTNSYTLPSSYTSGYNFVVGLLDRYGNEYIVADACDSGNPTTPVISSPANNSSVSSTVTVAWNTDTRATRGYSVERSTSSTFSSPTTNTVSAGTYQITYSGLTAGTTYYVRVRANYGTSSYTGWSSTLQFTVVASPTVPVISSPANNSTLSSPVTVIWNSQTAATGGFTVERSTSSGFSSPTTNTVSAGTYQITYSGLTAGTYYVRVRANYGTSDYTGWSSTLQFTILPTGTPSVPVIIFPVTGTTTGSTGTITWNPEPAATGFRVELSTSSNFSSIASSGTMGAGVYQATYSGLSNNRLYYVRVRANYGASSYTAWSVVQSFTVSTSTTPATPSITSPTSGSTVDSPVTVKWNPDTRATRGYSVERSTSSNFSNSTTNTVSAGTYQITYSGLTAGQRYYVRLRALYGSSSQTSASSASNFTVSSFTPLKLVIGQGANAPYTPLLALPPTVNVGDEVYLGIDSKNGVGTPSWVSRYQCTLTSSDPSVATITEEGGINAHKAGTTTLKAVRHTGGSGEGTIVFTVLPIDEPPTLGPLTLVVREAQDANAPAISSLSANKKGYLYIYDSDVKPVSPTDCNVTSTNTAVATINASGEISGVSAGTTTIKAVRKSDSSSNGEVELSVQAPVPPGITLNISSISTPNDPLPNEVDNNMIVYLWIVDNVSEEPVFRQDCVLTSSDPTVASIDQWGKITTSSSLRGSTTITAVRRVDNVTGTVALQVGKITGIITTQEDAIKIINTEAGIDVQFEGSANIELYTVSGVLIDKAQAFQSYSRRLAKGVYILRVNEQTKKFIK